MVKRSTIGECGTIVVAHLSFHAVFARVLLSVRAHLFHMRIGCDFDFEIADCIEAMPARARAGV